MGIVVIGAIFVDIKGFPSSTYIPEGRNEGQIKTVHGGVARNVAEDIANVELRPTFVSLIEEGGIGSDVVDQLKRHKVNTEYIRAVPDGMGTWLAVFDHNGDLMAAISKRPVLVPISETLDLYGDEIFRDCTSIVIELDLETEVLKKVFYYAEKYHKTVYAVVSNMSIAVKRRDYLQRIGCCVCNQQEAGILFLEDYSELKPEQMAVVLAEKIRLAGIPMMVVTMGEQGSVYAMANGERGVVPSQKVQVRDTTGAGDAFFAGVAIGLSYGKSMREACEIGTRMAASVICTTESVCPRFLPGEFGLDVKTDD